MASPNLSEIVATTLRNRSGRLADNVSNNNALLTILKQKGNVRRVDGGREIVEELDYQENRTYQRMSGYELIDIRPSDVISAATYTPKQVTVSVSISGREEAMNSGKHATIGLLRGRLRNAERTFRNGMSRDIYSDGTANGGKQITGLQAQVTKTPTTGMVGGINAANFSFWRNVTNTAVSLDFAALKAVWEELWVAVCRGMDKPDLLVADNDTYRTYWGGLTDLQRFTDRKMAGLGWSNNLKFNSATVVLDGGRGGATPDNTTYFLNTDYAHWRPYAGRDMVPLGGKRFAVNQDATVEILGFMGNLTFSNRFLQAVAQFS